MENEKDRELLNRIKSDPFLSAKYEILEVIGEGCFGKIIKVRQKGSNELRALKIQKFQKSRLQLTIRNEIDILNGLKGKYGVPTVYREGKWKYGMFIEMQLFGVDLNRNTKYDQYQIIELTSQMLRIMNGIHDSSVIHRDLKPHNIMKNNNNYFLIDYGLSKELSSSSGRTFMKGFIGTPRYASVRAHCMLEQSKKDDLQSLFYVIAYLYYRKLPWLRLKIPNQRKMQRIKALKMTSRDCLFNEMPKMFSEAFSYIVSLEHKEEPNYHYLRNLFKRNTFSIKIVPHLQETFQHKKKLSLNIGNYLQIPANNFGPPRNQLDGRSNSSSSLISGGTFSNRVMMDYFLQKQDDMYNMDSQLCSQPILPDITKFMKNLTIKNPFG